MSYTMEQAAEVLASYGNTDLGDRNKEMQFALNSVLPSAPALSREQVALEILKGMITNPKHEPVQDIEWLITQAFASASIFFAEAAKEQKP